MSSEKLSVAAAIKRYFERDDAQSPGGGRKVTIQEQQAFMKECTGDERRQLGELCAEQLGCELS